MSVGPETVGANFGIVGQVAVKFPRQRVDGVDLRGVRRQALGHMLVD